MKLTCTTKYVLLSMFPVASAMILMSCDRKVEDATITTIKVKPAWEWDKYKRAHELVLGVKNVGVQPKRSLEIRSESSGLLTLKVDKPKLHVVKDYMWAQMDKKKMDMEKEKIDLTVRSKLLEKEKDEQLVRPEKLKAAQKALAGAERDYNLLKRILKSKSLQKNAAQLLPGVTEISAKGLKESGEVLELAKKNLEILLEVDSILEADRDRLSEMEIESAKEVFEETQKRSNYEIPFSGELRLELDYIDGQSEYSVPGRQLIATLNDYAEMHILLSVLGESWVNLSPQSLVLQLNDVALTRVKYSDDKVEKNERTRREEKYYIFSAVTDENIHLKRLSGTSMQAKLITKLPKRCWIVPKVDVAMEALGKSNSKVWADIVDDIWPGAKLLAEGENELAIDYLPQRSGKGSVLKEGQEISR